MLLFHLLFDEVILNEADFLQDSILQLKLLCEICNKFTYNVPKPAMLQGR